MFETIKATFQMARRDEAGQGIVNKVVGVAVGILVTAIIVPVALNELGGVNNENWGSAGGTLLTLLTVLLPILAVISLVLYFTQRRD